MLHIRPTSQITGRAPEALHQPYATNHANTHRLPYLELAKAHRHSQALFLLGAVESGALRQSNLELARVLLPLPRLLLAYRVLFL